ncbi:uncharacterized protein LOC141630528 [Silene latifolia]|uniref:uncharacterized protein LOC141630528 n=1 Tax=Silene latifolia TaxID=37657 RepID=UPI003D774D83
METIVEEEDPMDLLKFTQDDIKSEVEFWNQSVYCYILGTNSPLEVVEDYVYQALSDFGIDRVSFMENGVFLVRFTTPAGISALLNTGYYFFDNKPIVIKPWSVEVDLVKEKIDVVLVWVWLTGIPLKFWGNCLMPIAGLVGWSITTNSSWHKGRRIWVLWKPELFIVTVLAYNAQYIHLRVVSRTDDKFFLLTMIYAHNDLYERVELWTFLKNVALTCTEPWLWAGDFNTVLSPVERLGGHTSEAEMQHFLECVSLYCVEDLQATGALFTWSNKQNPVDRVYSRLDRVMGNNEWMLEFGDYLAHFHPEGVFDHCPCTIINKKADMGGRKSFKYVNMWGKSEFFKDCVKSVWCQAYQGTKMFNVVKKLKALKPALEELNKACFSDIENSTSITAALLEKLQKDLVDHPGDLELMQQEMVVATGLRDLMTARDSFLIQKAKIQWSLEGDLNIAYFHNSIKKRMLQNKVMSFEDKESMVCTEGSQIQQAVLDYYLELLVSQKSTIPVNYMVVRMGECCTLAHWEMLDSAVTTEEVKMHLFSIPKDKSPGPDGFTSQFYRDAWDIVGNEVCAAVLDFFIVDLVRMYNRGTASPRCMFKMDLQKAYDSIEWNFLEQMLTALNFPEKFKHLVMICVRTPSFSLHLNGSHFGYFAGKRGLRQGDPISPLLFTIWDARSIMLMLRAFSTFSATYGLIVNVAKSEVVFAGVSDDLKHDILQVSGFQEGCLPFKYLGIPIQSGRITRQDCNILVEMIVTRIRGIGARKLSYSGRLILINSVLNTLHNYWASIFPIPKMIIRRIVAICRYYLWDGATEYHRAPLVAWSTVCCNKKSRGLGVKDAEKWNIATIGKLVNWIYTKADRLSKLDAGFVNNCWVADPKGYSVGSGYTWIQDIHPPMSWYSDVWDRWSIPKHAFIAWKYSQLQQHVCRMAKLACWYSIWMERNKCRMNFQLTMPDKIVKDVQRSIHARTSQMIMQPVTSHDQQWLSCLDILL